MKHFENINISKERGEHLYIQLYKAIKDLIIEGKLDKDEKLPPIRKLAEILNVNNVTVVNAYHILQEEGLVYKKMGSGTYISPDFLTYASEEKENSRITSFSLMEQGQIQINSDMINFASAAPKAELFPVEDFKKAINEVLDRDKGNAFDYQEIQGYLPLREKLIAYVRRYDIVADINILQVISGAQQGIDIIAKALLNYGDSVIVESPSYTGAMASFKSRGAKIIDVNMLSDGVDIEDLERKIRIFQPKFLYLMPNFQNPTGISYSRSKKEKIMELCRQYSIYVVEDDYLSDLNFYSKDNTTLKSLDRDNEYVIYIKSFSKILMPGLRLGFLIAPTIFYDNLIFAKHSSDISTSGLLQRTLELYFKGDAWDNHIQHIEEEYKSSFDVMVRCIEQYMPKEVHCIQPSGGVNFWFRLPDSISTKELYEDAINENIALAPGSLFFLNEKDDCHFRLSIASLNHQEIEEGTIKIGKIVKNLLNGGNNKLNKERYRPIL
ncbi:MocR-like pyridoxine biosynthesis transcription factor PdxR [Alkaliphilus oremlandii]|uniref:Transcriptional regulator, GntR family with aminotransferase domain n=1 Tax=Alkaliphilus oremlandii (strain OhILAs) TaxID=350688 RepID=A8MF60_ALKOO|nr:PLP-dependent aminotransferase family protein [Alkaliphilus oremlandii]ABW18729.1 transcriptional regulator, GntR family with aminotransferase domain [Alkaliphilus oremlandii OhILAs]